VPGPRLAPEGDGVDHPPGALTEVSTGCRELPPGLGKVEAATHADDESAGAELIERGQRLRSQCRRSQRGEKHTGAQAGNGRDGRSGCQDSEGVEQGSSQEGVTRPQRAEAVGLSSAGERRHQRRPAGAQCLAGREHDTDMALQVAGGVRRRHERG
jgi:hypothetical protein